MTSRRFVLLLAIGLCSGQMLNAAEPAKPAKPATVKPAAPKAASQAKPTAAKPPAAKPAVSKPNGSKPKDTKPAEPKPTDKKAVEGQAANKKPANRLAKETSPYLLLHAHNPVDWYPWGEEALAKAKAEKKPIFLSIGYSSCYWCHVMERESFLDEEIAALLNKHFVCIKVDREERPDLDDVYMRALQIYNQLAGSKQGGGWPMSMFLTPDTKPLFGGTYFPPRDVEGRTGFLTVVGKVQEAWENEPEKWQAVGDQIAGFVEESWRQRPALTPVALNEKTIAAVESALAEQFDAEHGGFGFSTTNARQPKFPEPPNLIFLIGRVARDQKQGEKDAPVASKSARAMLLSTLEKMAAGGIRDHLGGGFHRYSTDRYWRVPHFEKMLYDNGQLVSVYAAAWQLSHQSELRRVAEEAITFVERELTDPAGGFYAALDAETAGQEGKFYVWTRQEIEEALSAEEYKLAAQVYGLADEPNFEGEYILLLHEPLADSAKQLQISEQQLVDRLRPIREKLLAVRNERPRMLTDIKIISGWNGLMIAGLADAGRIFEQPKHTQAAARAARFVLEKLRTKDGRLQRSYAGGQAKLKGYLDDYAFFVAGLVALHRATGDSQWLTAADELTAMQIKLFWDDRNGGFFYTSTEHEQLLARGKSPTDGATPSGNSLSAANLVYLSVALPRPEYRERAEKSIRSVATMLEDSPLSVPQMAAVLGELLQSENIKELPAGKPVELPREDAPANDAPADVPAKNSAPKPPAAEE